MNIRDHARLADIDAENRAHIEMQKSKSQKGAQNLEDKDAVIGNKAHVLFEQEDVALERMIGKMVLGIAQRREAQLKVEQTPAIPSISKEEIGDIKKTLLEVKTAVYQLIRAVEDISSKLQEGKDKTAVAEPEVIGMKTKERFQIDREKWYKDAIKDAITMLHEQDKVISISSVCGICGFSHTLFYKYFPSKNAALRYAGINPSSR